MECHQVALSYKLYKLFVYIVIRNNKVASDFVAFLYY